LWIAFAAEEEGTITVDAGARDALVGRGTSLLPAGVTAVRGQFTEGSVVAIITADGAMVARGLALMSSDQVESALGRRSSDLPDGVPAVVVHRDDLVVFS
jgi:glutamate 5-kinase